MERLGVAALLLGFLATPARSQGVSSIRFVNRATESGITIRTTNGNPERNYIIEAIGGGAALLDFDGDDDLDLYVVNGALLEPDAATPPATSAFYRNDGSGRFTDITRATGLAELSFWGFGAATGDYDNDGDPDLHVTAWGPDHLFRNNADGTFTDVGRDAGVDDGRYGTSAAFLDYDADGDLDLYVANYVTFDPAAVPRKGDPDSPCTFRGLTVMCGPHGIPGAADALYRNNAYGTFTVVSEETGLFTQGGYYGLGVVTTDVNLDGLIDILVANDSTPNHYYRNLGNGRFNDDAVIAGFAYSNDGREQAGMGIDAADMDADGDQDIFITNFSHDYSTLRINDGNGYLEDSSVRLGLFEATVRSLGWGTVLFDFENDGDVDIFTANGHVYPEVERADIGTTYRQQNQFLENRGGLVLREIAHDLPADLHRGAAAGDIDGDGDVDLLVTVMNGQPELLVNESASGSWLAVRLAGRASNRDGVGARVVVTAGGRRWVAQRNGGGSYLSARDPRVRFGLGAVGAVDRIEVTWSSGRRQVLLNPPLNTVVTLLENDAPDTPAAAPAAANSP